MRYDIAIDAFKKLAREVASEIEGAIAAGDERYYNADIALRNVSEWLRRADDGTLAGSYRPSFGISKSDLMFGPVENRMYELERLYTDHILDAPRHAS
jgi:hypothetical protein